MVNRPSKEVLIQLYVKLGKSSTEIGGHLGAHPGSVRKWLKQYGIRTRNPKDYRAANKAPYPLKSRLVQMYVKEGRTVVEMAGYFKLPIPEIHRLLNLFEISRQGAPIKPLEEIPLPPAVEHSVGNQWSTDPAFAPYMRKVVKREQLPYAKAMDGTFIYTSMDTLSCGHTKATGTGRPLSKGTPYRDPATKGQNYEHRLCNRCKREAESQW